MKILLFEDDSFDLLYPLTYLRPVFELRCGATNLRQKIQEKFPDSELHLETRDILNDVVADTYGSGAVNNAERLSPDDDLLLVNAGAILTAPAETYTEKQRVAATEAGDFVWAFLHRDTVRELEPESGPDLARKATDRFGNDETDDILMKYPWDLVHWNASQIESDFEALYGPALEVELDGAVGVFGHRENLHIAEGAEVQPCVFLDCREGPIIIDKGARVHAHSSIHGPAYIGRDAQLFEARVREGTSIGPVCRAGGEIEESIMHAHSNKYHTGFLGHSYVCEWVNLGALTTNSDLKNDYSSVSVYVGGQPMDTGEMKVGSFIGDHTKTSIGTLLNTGSMVGIMCNLMAGASVLPKDIPSFCWYLEGRISKGLGLKEALKTARAAMGRRGVELTEAMVKLIKYTEDLTRPAKMEKVKRDRRRAFG